MLAGACRSHTAWARSRLIHSFIITSYVKAKAVGLQVKASELGRFGGLVVLATGRCALVLGDFHTRVGHPQWGEQGWFGLFPVVFVQSSSTRRRQPQQEERGTRAHPQILKWDLSIVVDLVLKKTPPCRLGQYRNDHARGLPLSR